MVVIGFTLVVYPPVVNDGLNSFLTSGVSEKPDIIVGNFNRKLPSTWAPKSLILGLEEAFADCNIVTRENLPPADARTVDHVAVASRFKPVSVRLLPAADDDGRARSDHDGVLVKLGMKSDHRAPGLFRDS